MFREIMTSLQQSLKERASNPLVGSYLCFLMLVNWRIPAILLLGDGDILDRMKLTEVHGLSPYLAHGIPLLLAFTYVSGMPFVAHWIHHWQQRGIIPHRKAQMEADLQLLENRKAMAKAEADIKAVQEVAAIESKKREAEFARDQERMKYELEKTKQLHDEHTAFHVDSIQTPKLREQIKGLEAQSQALKARCDELDAKCVELRTEVHVKAAILSRAESSIQDLNAELSNVRQQLFEKSKQHALTKLQVKDTT